MATRRTRSAEDDRFPEVPAEDVADPEEVLDVHRPVQAELAPQGLNRFLTSRRAGHDPGGIPRRDVDHAEN